MFEDNFKEMFHFIILKLFKFIKFKYNIIIIVLNIIITCKKWLRKIWSESKQMTFKIN